MLRDHISNQTIYYKQFLNTFSNDANDGNHGAVDNDDDDDDDDVVFAVYKFYFNQLYLSFASMNSFSLLLLRSLSI